MLSFYKRQNHPTATKSSNISNLLSFVAQLAVPNPPCCVPVDILRLVVGPLW